VKHPGAVSLCKSREQRPDSVLNSKPSRQLKLQTGYLSIETSSDRPELLRLVLSDRCPTVSETEGPDSVRYIARFNDGEAALMHTHQLLRRRLVDVGAGLYRVDLVSAVAAIESLGLSHGRIYLDPHLSQQELGRIDARVLQLQTKRLRRERFWYAVGYIALGVLLLQGIARLFWGAG